MRKHSFRKHLLLAAGAGILLSVHSAVIAEESPAAPDTSNWVCKFCLVTNGWWGEWDLGAIHVDDTAPKFADYRGFDDDGWYLEASGYSRYLNEKGHYVDIYGRNLGLDSRAIDMRGGKQGRYEVRAAYSEIPRYLGNGTVTPYQGVGTNVLTLPVTWQQATWAPARLESKRKTWTAGLSLKMGSAWKFDADVERQSRDGTRTFTSALLALNAVHFPGPVDYTTDLLSTGLEYAGKRGQLRMEFAASEFDNGYDSVTLDSPFFAGPGQERLRNALAPDNEYRQISLAGSYRLNERFRLSGKASVGEMEQNVQFLPYSINPKFDDLQLPRASLDGQVDTNMLNLAGRAYLRLANRLDLNVQYKVNERDNKTPVDVYDPVLLETATVGPITNRPYGYDRKQAALWLRWRPRNDLRLNMGVKRDELERTYQDVLETAERSYWIEVGLPSLTWAGARLKIERLKRDLRQFEEQGYYYRAENPLMRKFNMADRDRKRATLQFDLMPSDRFDLALSYYLTDDEYRNSVLGLTDSEENTLSLDFNFAVNEETNFYAFVTKDEIDARMAGAASPSAQPWRSISNDEILTWGLGISGSFNKKFRYGLDYVNSESESDILTDSGAGEAPFPTLETELANTRIYLKYQVSDRWGLTVDAYREDYDSSSWYIDGLGPLDISSVLTMGDVSPEYDATVVRLFATLTF
jgi:MtrB/PioB family decaheme-associated outer membrane protein